MATSKESAGESVKAAGGAVGNYFQESYQEVRKVAWPTRNRAIRLTLLVLGFVAVVAVVIGILDYGFGIGHSALLELAPEGELPTIQQPAQHGGGTVTVPEADLGEVTLTTDEGEISGEALELQLPETEAESAEDSLDS